MPTGLSRCQVDRLTPAVVQTALARCAVAGATVAVLSGRFRVLHSAISWALCERLVRSDPLVGMRSPARPYPRKHVRHELVRRLISTAERLEGKARARLVLVERPDCRARARALFRAEQDVLLVRWPLIPVLGGVSWRRCGWMIWTGGCCRSSVRPRTR